MKPLIIYHASCADGFGAAFAAWLKFGDEAKYLPMQYGKTLEQYGEEVGDVFELEVYILDFSFPKIIMDEIMANAKHVVWLDHHKTAFEMWCGGLDSEVVKDGKYEAKGYTPEYNNAIIILDNNKSGALLAWEYFHPDTEVPMLIKHIDDYDRWQFKLEGTKEFNAALRSYQPWSFEQWGEQFYDQDEITRVGLGFIRHEGAAILRAHEANVQAVVKGASRKCMLILPNIDGFEPDGLTLYGFAANCLPHLASDVGHALATQSGTYGLLWHLDKDGKCKCSLRSNGDYDVSEIAKAFGGGGHRNAAGFEVDVQTLLGWVA